MHPGCSDFSGYYHDDIYYGYRSLKSMPTVIYEEPDTSPNPRGILSTKERAKRNKLGKLSRASRKRNRR